MESGIYFRVERNGKWGSLDLTEMTQEEILQATEKFNREQLVKTIFLLAQQMNELDLIEEE